MPLGAMVTPLSLYMLDDTIFDGIELPTPPANPTDYPDLYVSGFQLDRTVLIDNLLMETGEMNVIYPDPEFFKYAVTQWSKKEKHVWQALFDTLFYKYNPLWNKDGTIKETALDLTERETAGSRSRTGTVDQTVTDNNSEMVTHNLQDLRTPNLTHTGQDTTTNTGTVTDAGTSSKHTEHDGDVTTNTTGSKSNTGTVGTSETGSTENKVSAYNSSAYENRDKSDNTGSSTRTDNLTEGTTGQEVVEDRSIIDETGTAGNTRTDNLVENYDTETHETGTETISHTGTLSTYIDNTSTTDRDESETESTSGTDTGSLDHTLTRTEQGNIGVTQTAMLIQAQRDLVKFNFYDLIIERFKERFCLLVY